MLYSLLVSRKFSRGQHRYTLLRCTHRCLSGRWATVVHSCVRYELTHRSCLNNTGVRDISYVTANVLINTEERLMVVHKMLLRLLVFFGKKGDSIRWEVRGWTCPSSCDQVRSSLLLQWQWWQDLASRVPPSSSSHGSAPGRGSCRNHPQVARTETKRHYLYWTSVSQTCLFDFHPGLLTIKNILAVPTHKMND